MGKKREKKTEAIQRGSSFLQITEIFCSLAHNYVCIHFLITHHCMGTAKLLYTSKEQERDWDLKRRSKDGFRFPGEEWLKYGSSFPLSAVPFFTCSLSLFVYCFKGHIYQQLFQWKTTETGLRKTVPVWSFFLPRNNSIHCLTKVFLPLENFSIFVILKPQTSICFIGKLQSG